MTERANDCLYACLAMLSGASIEEIKHHGDQNRDLGYPKSFGAKVAAVKRYAPWFDGPFRFFFGNGLRKPDPDMPLLIPTKGRGLVAFYNPEFHLVEDGIMTDCHLCVYSDGLLFDPEHSQPFNVEGLRLTSGGAVAFVVPEA